MKHSHKGKILAFIGIVVIAINQYFELITNIFYNRAALIGVGIVVLSMGILADEIMGGKK